MSKNILFNAFPKQVEFLEAVFKGLYKYILYGGAIRGGKTFAGLGALILLCKKYPCSRWAIVRDTLPTLKRTTIPSFFKLCPSRILKSYNQDTQTVTFTNGSQILFFAENYDDDKELNRWKGLEVNGFLFEEVNECQAQSFYKAIERAGAHIPKAPHVKPKPLILMTCNPADNWIKELVYDKWEAGTLPPDFLYIPSKITDNPYVMADTDYVESLKNMPRYQYEVFVNGDWNIKLKVGGEFYKCFEVDLHIGETVYNPTIPLHISFDDNVNPYLPTGIYQIYKTEENGKHVGYIVKMIDEIVGKNPRNTVKDNCNEILRKYNKHETGAFLYGDATANKEDTKLEKGYNFFRLILDYLRPLKIQSRVLTANPAVVMRGQWLNTVLEKELAGIKIVIGRQCKEAIADFIGLKEAADGTKLKEPVTDNATKVRYQKFGHFSDLFDYFMCSAFASQFIDWQRGGRGMGPSYGGNKSNNRF